MPDTHTAVDPQLLAAYRATHYVVHAPDAELSLRIDQPDARLAALLRAAHVDSAALITAWNPRSELVDPQRNRALQSQLVRELVAAGFRCIPARHVAAVEHGGGKWHEDSVLVPGITSEGARAVAARHGQLAFVWIDAQATPRLVFTAAGLHTGDVSPCGIPPRP